MDAQQATVAIPPEVLDSLCSRFLINIPAEERNNMIRVFFQIELAHWFYIDFYRPENATLPGCSIKEFTRAIFRHCPFLKEHNAKVDEHFYEWKEYKMSVPTYGAIMLNETLQHIVLVQSYFKTNWGFPKGKVNQGETATQCAIREVSEETGCDISSLIDEDEFIEATFNDQLSRLYVVPNVPMDTEFKPKTRGEIKGVKWFHIDDLPVHKKDNAPKLNLGLNPNNFFMAIPYMKKLKKKIDKLKGHKDPPRIESPLEALTKVAQPNAQAAYQYGSDTPGKEKMSGPPTINGMTADNKQLLNDHRHKMKQQRAFVSQNQSQNDAFLRLRDSQHDFRDGSNGKRHQQHNRASPTAVQTHTKQKMQLNGAASPQKQYQILTRNPASKGHLGDLYADSVIHVANGNGQIHRESLSVPAFTNFRLDTAAIMRAFDNGLYSRTTFR